ncbi:MAG: phospholipase C, phosphocholine-specific [Catenulispora sp.]|nr:phospholipase C, phosphocholine-specific [Catenulispora sp.]
MSPLTRRKFLSASAAAAAGAALIPESMRSAMAATAGMAGTLNDVGHIVVFMQENRSFDHYFGTLAGVRGFSDPTPFRFQNGTSVSTQPNGSGTLLPWHLDTKTTSAQCVADLDHSWSGTHNAWASGSYNGWVAAKTNKTMGYYTRADIPFQYALADAFTICDANFCSVLGPTNPNRLYLWTGMIDPNGTGGGPVTDNSEKGYTWTTYPERLQAAGVTWKVYQETDNYDDNALAWFNQYKNAATSSPLYQRGMVKSTDSIAEFQADVTAGTLPQVSWIVAPAGKSEHPNYAPALGADYVSKILTALSSNLNVWSKTVLVLNYDENDGFFDHVIPPTPPAGTPDEFVGGLPIGLGVRVPQIVISPWSQGGWVDSTVYDHTSSIRLIEKWTGVHEPNISAWRRAVCGDLTNALNFTTSTTTFPSLPATGPLVTAANSECSTLPAPTPPASQSMPAQESGTKGQRATQYQPNVTGRYDVANGRFWTDFSNAGAQAVPLQAYTMAYRTFANWQYLVQPNSTSSDYWSAQTYGAGKYSLDVHGPNGFLRSFVGDLTTISNAALAHLEVKASYDTVNNKLVLTMTNTGGASAVVTVQANTYITGGPWTFTVGAGATVTNSWATANGWYDLTATANVGDNFLRRFAGKIEVGQPATPTGGPAPAVLDRTGWTVKYCDSQETVGESAPATNVLDGDTTTIWHTQWYNVTPNPPCPHEVQLDMKTSHAVSGFTYLPRQDGSNHGWVGQYEFSVSADGTNWGTAVATGTFAASNALKTVNFAAATGRYVRFRALTEVNGNPWTSCAELNVIGI